MKKKKKNNSSFYEYFSYLTGLGIKRSLNQWISEILTIIILFPFRMINNIFKDFPATSIFIIVYLTEEQDSFWAFFILTLAIDLGLESLTITLISSNNTKSLIRFLKKDLPHSYKIQEENIEKLFSKKVIEKIKLSRELAFIHSNAICRILLLVKKENSIDEHQIISQDKGFIIPTSNTGKLKDRILDLSSNSFVFIQSFSQNISLMQKYLLLHEIGHTTKFALEELKYKTSLALQWIIIIGISFLAQNWLLGIFYYLLYSYTCDALLNKEKVNLRIEIIADSFAIELLDEKTNWVLLKRIMQRFYNSNNKYEKIRKDLLIEMIGHRMNNIENSRLYLETELFLQKHILSFIKAITVFLIALNTGSFNKIVLLIGILLVLVILVISTIRATNLSENTYNLEEMIKMKK
jgi:hypothetical protein